MKTVYKLKHSLTYDDNGDEKETTCLHMHEPVSDSDMDCMKFSQVVRNATISVMKNFFSGDEDDEKPQAVEQEQETPFFMQEKPNNEDVLEQVNGLTELLMSSEVDITKILKAGKKILTSRYAGPGRRRLCEVGASSEPLTEYLYKQLSATDKIRSVVWYYVFFGISSIGR